MALIEKVNEIDIRHDVPGAVPAALDAGTDSAEHPDVHRELTRRAPSDAAPANQTTRLARAKAFGAERVATLLESLMLPGMARNRCHDRRTGAVLGPR